jgi:hypothetical protein
MPHRVGEAARDPLEIGENPVAPLVMQAAEGGTEELAVIHRKTWNGTWSGAAFLERFKDGCRAGIGFPQAQYASGRVA